MKSQSIINYAEPLQERVTDTPVPRGSEVLVNHAATGFSKRINNHTSRNPTAQPMSTSCGKCTARYMRERPIKKINNRHNIHTHLRFKVAAIKPNTAAEFCAWLEGSPNEDSKAKLSTCLLNQKGRAVWKLTLR